MKLEWTSRLLYLLLIMRESSSRLEESSLPLGPLPTDRPLVIAHRGSSGMLPEHTVEAYKLAVEQGADVIECDLVVTKDLKLVCLHEPWLNASTDVHDHPEFRDRVRTYSMESQNITDYFTVDFTLAELKTLKKIQSRKYRDQSYNGKYSIATFDEYMEVAKNSSNPQTVGIYPELKHPAFFNKIMKPEGTSMEDIVLESLERHGYTERLSPCFIQSFDIHSLQSMSNRTNLRLIFLIETDLSSEDMEKYSSYISGIGPWKNSIVEINPVTNTIANVTGFVQRAHSFGYLVHAYTFRNEYQFLAYEYGADPYREYKQFVDLGLDGFFTDFPWSLSNYLELKANSEECLMGGSANRLSSSWMIFQIITCSIVTTQMT